MGGGLPKLTAVLLIKRIPYFLPSFTPCYSIAAAVAYIYLLYAAMLRRAGGRLLLRG